MSSCCLGVLRRAAESTSCLSHVHVLIHSHGSSAQLTLAMGMWPHTNLPFLSQGDNHHHCFRYLQLAFGVSDGNVNT